MEEFKFIFLRQDPPFNMHYITSTYLLERLPKSCMILNKPNSIRDCPEKLFVMDFINLMPPTLISKQKSNIIKFVNKFKKVVIKPIYGNGGSNVFYLNEKDPNLNIIIDSLISETQHVIVQKFIKNVKIGDKRIIENNNAIKKLVAHYIVNEKNHKGLPINEVSRFHLGNGAIIDDIVVNANISDVGFERSFGVMVNYLYELKSIEKNHEDYINNKRVIVSDKLQKFI